MIPAFLARRVTPSDAEAILGALVLGVAALLFVLVYGRDVHPSAQQGGLVLDARFRHADGIIVGSDVRAAGVVVGKVVEATLDDQFRAVTRLQLRPGLALPIDTAAAIESDSLLGSKFIELKIGGEDDLLKSGGEITYTQDSLTFEKLMDMILSQARSKRGYVGKELPKVL